MRTKLVKPWNFEGASCWGIDTEMFFTEGGGAIDNLKTLKIICTGCRWKQECLTYALHYDVQGVWGGTTPPERRKIRRRLKITARPITNERKIA